MMNLAIYSAQVLLVVAAATVSLALFRLAMPRARLTYWRVVVLICLLLPGLPGRRAPSVVQRGDVTSSVLVTGGEPAGMRAPALATAVVESLPWIAVIGAAARGAWLAIGLLRLRRLRRPGERAILDDSLTVLHRDLAPDAELRWHERLTQPVTFGWRHPVVLLPTGLSQLPLDVQRAVVCHELVHVARRDWIWTLLEEIVRSIFWFHPAMRWALAQVQLSREETVDTKAVVITGARLAYMRALMMFADMPAPTPATLFVRRRQVVLRMKSISEEVHMSPIRLALIGTALAGVLGGSTLAITAAMPLQSTVTAPVNSQETAAHVVAPDPAGAPTLPPRLHRRVVREVKAAFPPEAIENGVDASVIVNVTVNSAGDVTRVDDPKWQLTIRSDSHVGDERLYWAGKPWTPFVREAETAARQWKFVPAETESTSKLSFTFRTSGDAAGTVVPTGGVTGGAVGGVPGGVLSGIPGGVPGGGRETLKPVSGVASARPGEVPPNVIGKGPLRVGGAIKPPTKIYDVKPIYPEDAKAERVEGVVVLDVTIATDGSVADATVRRSIPLLDQAALDAVRQWRFIPTLMNGAPIEVLMTITVNFTLQ